MYPCISLANAVLLARGLSLPTGASTAVVFTVLEFWVAGGKFSCIFIFFLFKTL